MHFTQDFLTSKHAENLVLTVQTTNSHTPRTGFTFSMPTGNVSSLVITKPSPHLTTNITLYKLTLHNRFANFECSSIKDLQGCSSWLLLISMEEGHSPWMVYSPGPCDPERGVFGSQPTQRYLYSIRMTFQMPSSQKIKVPVVRLFSK